MSPTTPDPFLPDPAPPELPGPITPAPVTLDPAAPEHHANRPPADIPTLSRYMHKTLLPEEKIVGNAHFPGIYVLMCYVLLFSVAFLGGVMQYGVSFYAGLHTSVPLLGGAALGFFLFMSMMMKMWTTEIVLTDRRLIYKRGFFSIKVDEVDIEQLASQKVHQTLLGRLMDYGGVYVRCIEASDVYLPPIAHPYGFVNALERQKQHYRDAYSTTNRLRQHGMGPGDK